MTPNRVWGAERARGHVFIACSLDGYIATQGGEIDWLNTYAASGEEYGYEEFIASVDGIVMGRRTYEKALSFPAWPYELPVVVTSRSMKSNDLPIELTDSVEVSDADPADLVSALTERGLHSLYIDGGQVIQSFMRAGLIDEMIVSRVPLLLGAGIPLFGSDGPRLEMEHVATKSFPSGLVQSRYRATTR